MDVKKHLNIDEQIELLKLRGCIIEDEEIAKSILLDINYYRLTSYFLPFRETGDKYLEGTYFSKVYRNYLFDRKLRNMLSFIIEHIEVAIKTRIAYYHSLKYGPLGYLDSNNYNSKFDEVILQSLDKKKEYLVIVHNIYAPFHYSKAIVRESDLDQIENTFILNEVKLEDLKLDMSIKEVMKLKFIDLYNNEWIEFINSGYDNFINFRNNIKKI